ncbi:hypothetical protein ACSU1N_00165 [Thermogladius sp. 4427co]|uniref:hypothetical protein n=1 Tax=Thermogladius sp. 4427co TaxID=3450718 RepID=UPI003F7B1ADF
MLSVLKTQVAVGRLRIVSSWNTRLFFVILLLYLLRLRRLDLVLIPVDRDSRRLSFVERALFKTILSFASRRIIVDAVVFSIYDYAFLSRISRVNVSIDKRVIATRPSTVFNPYPKTLAIALLNTGTILGEEFEKLVEFLVRNRIGLLLIVSTTPRKPIMSFNTANIVTTSFEDIAWSVSLCVIIGEGYYPNIMASTCVENRRPVVSLFKPGIIIETRLSRAVKTAFAATFEGLTNTILETINRLDDIKKLFIQD